MGFYHKGPVLSVKLKLRISTIDFTVSCYCEREGDPYKPDKQQELDECGY